MTRKTIDSYKKVGGVFSYSALHAILIIFLLGIVSSCSNDEEQTPDYMTQLYDESLTLQYQSADSIESFTQKFYGYLEYNPDAYNHPYYTAIDEKICKASPQPSPRREGERKGE